MTMDPTLWNRTDEKTAACHMQVISGGMALLIARELLVLSGYRWCGSRGLTHQFLIRVRPYWQALVTLMGRTVGSFCFCLCGAVGLIGTAHSAGGLPTRGMSIEPGGGTSRKREKDAGEDHSGTTSGGGKKHSAIDRRS